MAIAEAAKIVFQTALAGTLESKGFKRVSDTNYVIEGDGIEWRVVFGPEFKDDPGTFREETGVYLPEIDELYQKAFPNDGPISSPLAMTKYRAHYSYDIQSGFIERQRKAGVKNPNLMDSEPCFRKQEWSQGRREHWTTSNQNLNELGRRINKHWIDNVLPWFKASAKREDVCKQWNGDVLVQGFQTDLFGPWVCGHRNLVEKELQTRVDEALVTEDEIRARLSESQEKPFFFWQRTKPISDGEVAEHKRFLIHQAKLAAHLSSILGSHLERFSKVEV